MNNITTDKRLLLDLAFNGKDEKAIKVLTGVYDIIEMERLLKLPKESLSNQQLEKCLEYLSIDTGKPYRKLNLSTWTNEQLESRLFELDNKLIEHE